MSKIAQKIGGMSESDELCLICGRKTKGFHCQVNSCRACRKCDLTKNITGKPICRYCRFKRCLEVGMTVDSANSETLPSVITTPEMPEKCVTVNYEFDGKSFLVNWDSLAESINEVLNIESHFIPNFGSTHLTEMQKFQIGLERLINYGKAKANVKHFNEGTINREEIVNFYLKYITFLCQILTSLNSFMKFSSKDKFLLFKNFWRGFRTFDRLYATFQHFGYETAETITLIDNQHISDISKQNFLLSVLTDKERESYLQLTTKSRETFIRNILIPFKQLRPTQMELGYLGFLLLWDVQNIPELGNDAIEVSNEQIDKASSEMHNYYTYELRLPNYALRLIKMNKLISECQKQTEERKQIVTMAQVFNLFNYDLIDCKILD
uniref:Nuclear receptor n=1 Tax=Panagrolaimus sp. PS1159 TaxID=55785 RepID=A0AC35G872_9BILA